jgi:hypothetical protein
LRRLGTKFTIADLTDSDIELLLSDERCKNCSWLRGITERWAESNLTIEQIRIEIVRALYLVGLIGVKHPTSHQVRFSADRALDTSPDIIRTTVFHMHKMFWSALGLSESIQKVAGAD